LASTVAAGALPMSRALPSSGPVTESNGLRESSADALVVCCALSCVYRLRGFVLDAGAAMGIAEGSRATLDTTS
jgi:hypothetical protein